MSTRLLVVDDQRTVLQLLSGFLETCGSEVLSVVDAQAADWRLEDVAFNGAFHNVHISAHNGFDLTRLTSTRSLNGNIQIVLFSSFDTPTAIICLQGVTKTQIV